MHLLHSHCKSNTAHCREVLGSIDLDILHMFIWADAFVCADSAPPEPPAKEVQPPEDVDLKRTIDAMAPFVARNGAAFEAIAVRQNARDNRFSFLKGGPGAEYYRWRVQASSVDFPLKTVRTRLALNAASRRAK